ncbi:aldo/keto reductase [Spirillospora sp. NBC_01491]|uniref:aldo/keto reductase n=1 Tax=Spirillospora sp. NBC_01491 TaxID=2976007 RepID=UPI002E322EB9|nr:aldo/keto reductase [Spirillospora sp. NBC_01491]
MSTSRRPRRSRHPTLNSVLEKLQHGVDLTEGELSLLKGQLDDLEHRAQDQAVRRAEAHGPAPAADPDVRDAYSERLAGHATPEGTTEFASRFGAGTVDFYRPAQGLSLSTIGIGTHLGAADEETDAMYADAVRAALRTGANLIDTSLTYRRQRSERATATGLRRFIDNDGGDREQVVVCTKGGYLLSECVTPGALEPTEVAGGVHSIAPAFLADQIRRSRQNLGLETIDVYYLHNPETQLKHVGGSEFMRRIRAAFHQLECAVSDGSIRYYGTATWDGYRSGLLSLPALVVAAREVGGDGHHLRFLQLPLNLGMQEALTHPAEGGGSVLKLAAESGITVIVSASLLQGRLARDLTADTPPSRSGLRTDAQRAIQFARSRAGVTSALVGMRSVAHVAENLALARDTAG